MRLEGVMKPLRDSEEFNYLLGYMNKGQYPLSAYGLSECFQTYYSDIDKFGKRYQYSSNAIGFSSWSIPAIKNRIMTYYDNALVLKAFFSIKEGLYPGAAEAAALALALNILYWAKVEGVSLT